MVYSIRIEGDKMADYTMYHDFVHDPAMFERNNVLYHYSVNHDKLRIGKFCSIACGAKFLFNSANHTMDSLSTYPFPLFFEEWGLEKKNVTKACKLDYGFWLYIAYIVFKMMEYRHLIHKA